MASPKNLNHDLEQTEMLDRRKKLDLIPGLGTYAAQQSTAEVVDLSVCLDGTIADTMIILVQCSIQSLIYLPLASFD